MESLRLLGETFWAPLAAFRRLAESPRSFVALLVLILAQLSFPLALRGRVSLREQVLSGLAMTGKLADTSEHDIDDGVAQAQKLQLVGGVAGAVFSPPLTSLILAILLWMWTRVLGSRPTFKVLFAAATHAQIPLAFRALSNALAASRQTELDPSQIGTLVPSDLGSWVHLQLSGPWAHAIAGADFFRLWMALLVGVALYAAGGLGSVKAVVGSVVGYAAFVAVVFVGMPGMGGA